MSLGIAPAPPIGSAAMPWDRPSDDPVAAIAADRDALGDTFVVHSGGRSYLFLFSASGVRAFYALPEDRASKGVADLRMLARKVPPELFDGRRTIPHDMFTRSLATAHLEHVAGALTVELEALGEGGELEVFEWARRLGHRFGLASWGGPGAATGARFDRLVSALDRLDPAASFVTPEAMAAVAATDHADERAALAEIEGCYEQVVAAHDADPEAGMFATIADRWRGEPGRVAGVARDVALVHLGSMSNLFAAIGWSIVHLAHHPETLERVRAGDRAHTERAALESVRLAQRSVMLREVLAPVELDVDGVVYRVDPGATVATLLPLTNRSAAPGLDRYDPDRWRGRRLAPHPGLAAVELVTAFGHGAHTCPAQPFSLTVMTATMTALAAGFDLELDDPFPRPRRGQIGGVARSERPCRLRYTRRGIRS